MIGARRTSPRPFACSTGRNREMPVLCSKRHLTDYGRHEARARQCRLGSFIVRWLLVLTIFAVFPGVDAEACLMHLPERVGIYDPTDEPGSHPALITRLFIQVIFEASHMMLVQSSGICTRNQRNTPGICCEWWARLLRTNNEDSRAIPVLAGFPSIGHLFGYSNCGVPGQETESSFGAGNFSTMCVLSSSLKLGPLLRTARAIIWWMIAGLVP
jgi:hypothetical protein